MPVMRDSGPVMSSSFTLGDGDGPRPTPPPSGDPQLPADPAGLLVEQGRAGLTAPLDDIHLWSDAALAVIRTEFADARRRANAWTPAPCPQLADALARLTEMERA